VFGSSTGGPTVLETIFSGLCGPLSCPILIAQHMPPIFTAALAERLSKLSGIPAKEASHKEIVKPNTIYIAPGDYHLTVQGTAENCELHLDQKEKENFVRPAVDPLFRSAAHIYRDRCLGLVLTGMGSDGRNGAQAIKEAGGAVIIQDRKSSVVFGMPGAVEQAQAFDKMISPQEMIHLLREKICPFSTHGGYSFAKN
jgi:two-component system chemotaxis response regulator CheB